MTDGRKNHVQIERWENVTVTPLPPGWRNVFRSDGLTLMRPCPALLLQEERVIVEYWRVSGELHSRTTVKEPPYETRVAFADYAAGELHAAVEEGDYVTTLAPGEDLPEGTEGGSPA